MSRFVLELTPLNRGIKNSKILMLGDWCEPTKERNETIIDYHWDDRSKLYKDYEYIFSLYEKYLDKLSKGLNEIHGTNHSIEFWRIIVGPWLHYFISIVLDRHEMLKIATKNYEIKHTRIPSYNSNEWIPIDYVDFNQKYYTDEWNYYLYSEILKHSELIKTKKTKYQLLNKPYKNTRRPVFKLFLFFLTRLFRWFPRRVTFVEVDIPQKSLYKFA